MTRAAFMVSVMLLSPCACQALNTDDAIGHRLQPLYRGAHTMQDARMPQIDIRAINKINPRRRFISSPPRCRINTLPRRIQQRIKCRVAITPTIQRLATSVEVLQAVPYTHPTLPTILRG